MARKRKGGTFVPALAELRVYRRGRALIPESQWIREPYRGWHNAHPHERRLAGRHPRVSAPPTPPSGRLPHRPLSLLTTSHLNKVIVEGIKANRLDFAYAQFYRSSHLATGGPGRGEFPNQCYGELRGESLWFVTLTDPFTRRAFLKRGWVMIRRVRIVLTRGLKFIFLKGSSAL